ncbi:saposin A [Cavenderia fasciculata]|uniref:Saposin A n=1 Tax=Cavenderia fasciculata TaxID=261658 RepID=F4PJE4_CACFS|nr:saposin A [Cavenderia fasciculata]EGG24430.1 saposin A [Cavenderia fasciculata]|eukprot:XP_004362281.1 saposin A [Cavenderia fasciculata]
MKLFTTIALLVAFLAIFSIQTTSADALECSVCTYVLSYVEDFVQQNKTLAEIETGLDIACAVLPKTWKDDCDVIVDSYAPLMVKMLINKENPQTICGQVKLCNTSSVVEAEAKHFYKLVRQNKVAEAKVAASGLECDLCGYIVNYVETYVANNATESQILQFLDKDCNILRNSEWVSECQTLVNDYAPLIIQYLENKEPAATVCSQIKLCPTNGNKSGKPCAEKKQKALGNEECAVCTFVVSYAEQLLADNKTLGPIETFLEAECDKFLPKYASTCNAAISNYLPEIIQYLENGQTPAQVCQEIKFCTAPSAKATEFKYVKENKMRHHAIKKATITKKAVDATFCSACEIVVQQAVRYLGNNATDQEVLAFIENDCTFFRNQQFVQECQTFVTNEGETVIKYIISNPNPETTCTDLHFCSSDAQIIHKASKVPQRRMKLN